MSEHDSFTSGALKRGRPKTVEFEQFVEEWEKLQTEGRAKKSIVMAILGGGSATISQYIERYEREKSAKTIAVIKDIELPLALKKIIADFKVKELTLLEQENQELKVRIDGYIGDIDKAWKEASRLKVDAEDAEFRHLAEQQNLNTKIAVMQERANDFKAQEKMLLEKLEGLTAQLADAKQDAAVARKEVEMLRETIKDKKPS